MQSHFAHSLLRCEHEVLINIATLEIIKGDMPRGLVIIMGSIIANH